MILRAGQFSAAAPESTRLEPGSALSGEFRAIRAGVRWGKLPSEVAKLDNDELGIMMAADEIMRAEEDLKWSARRSM